MKSEQLDRMVKKLSENGFGYIAAAELRKLARLVLEAAILDAVFEPLGEEKPDMAIKPPPYITRELEC